MGLIESVHGGYVHERRIVVLSDWCSKLIPFNSKCSTSAAVMADYTRLIADKRPDISIQGIDVRPAH